MQDIDDKQIEWLISRHLSKELDPQLGRAAKFFAQQALPLQTIKMPLPWRSWVGAALAASILICWGIYGLHQKAQHGIVDGPHNIVPASGPVALEPLSEEVAWRTVDDGTVVMDDDRPARRLLRQVVERVSWYDPKDKTTVELTVPHEQVMLIGLNSY